jgi:hypothetical protein
MTFTQLGICCVAVFVILIVLIMRLLMAQHAMHKLLPLAFPLAFLILLGAVFVIAYSGRHLPMAGIILMIPFALALPTSLLIPPLKPDSEITLLLLLAACGTFQYLIIGWIVHRMICRKK